MRLGCSLTLALALTFLPVANAQDFSTREVASTQHVFEF